VLADLKERQPEFRKLRQQLLQRATNPRRAAKVAVASGVADAVPEVTDGAEMPDEQVGVTDDITATTASVGASRTAGTAGPRPASGPRQQPTRKSGPQRRPSGKKKRR
jgi:hypothetical protein